MVVMYDHKVEASCRLARLCYGHGGCMEVNAKPKTLGCGEMSRKIFKLQCMIRLGMHASFRIWWNFVT